MPLEIKVRAVPDTATFVSDLQKAADRLKLTIPVELNTATSQALNTAVESSTGGTTGQKVLGLKVPISNYGNKNSCGTCS